MDDDPRSASALVLLLADARLPSGAHVHSGGVEQAVDDGVITDVESLELFLVGRLMTGGRLAAHVSALSFQWASAVPAVSVAQWQRLDAEVSARIIAPALQSASRRQGKSLLRTGAAMFGGTVLATLDVEGPVSPHLAVVQGALAAQSGVAAIDAALVAAYSVVTSAASAALRLLGLDPVAVMGTVARLAAPIDREARVAASRSGADPQDLPSPASPATDLLGQRHAQRKERLFAS
jgi:urease accessory protein